MSNVLPVGSGPFRRGLLSRYDTTESIQQRTRRKRGRRRARGNAGGNGNDAMFFAAPMASAETDAATSGGSTNYLQGHETTSEVKKLQHAISLPYLDARSGRRVAASRSAPSSTSLPRLQTNDDKRVEVETRHRQIRQQKRRARRTKQKKVAQKRQQQELYSQNMRYLKQQQTRGLRDRQQQQYEHNGFLRRENLEKQIAHKVKKENDAVSINLEKVAQQAQQKADEYVKKIMLERQAEQELEQIEREKQRKQQEEATEMQYESGIRKQERLGHWNNTRSPVKVAEQQHEGHCADGDQESPPAQMDEPLPMHHFISKDKAKARVRPRKRKGKVNQSKTNTDVEEDSKASEEAKRQEKMDEAERRKAKAKAARVQQRAERDKEKEMWRRLDKMAISDGMANGGSAPMAAGLHQTLAVDWEDLEEKSRREVANRSRLRKEHREEAKQAKIAAEQHKAKQWEDFLALEQTGGASMMALLQQPREPRD